MTETETIKAAFAKFANAADVYEQAKRELAELLGTPTTAKAGGGTHVAEPTKKTDPALDAVKERMTTGRKPATRAPATGTLATRILGLVADGAEWSVTSMAAALQMTDATLLSGSLSRFVTDGVLVRVKRGVYKKGAKEPSGDKRGYVNKDHVLPQPGSDGLTPLERAKVAAGKTRYAFGANGEQDPPTAVERILGALGSGPKKWTELLELCSLTTPGASEALSELTKAGKVTSLEGKWKLKEVA